MFTRPRIKSSFRVEIVEPDAVFLLGEHRQHVFEGSHYVECTIDLDCEEVVTLMTVGPAATACASIYATAEAACG